MYIYIYTYIYIYIHIYIHIYIDNISFLATSIYWTSKGPGKRYFAEKNLIGTFPFLIRKCYFLRCSKEILEPLGVLTLFLSRKICFSIFLSLSMIKILFLTNQQEHMNTMLRVNS